MLRSIKSKDFFLAVLSAALLKLSFPKTDLWILAWTGLVPLLTVLEEKPYKQAFGWSYLCGVLFFGGILYWIGHVTVLGTVVLVAYLALYFGFFGIVCVFFRRNALFSRMLLLPAAWVVLEFTRDHLFSGFGWGSLGLSQHKNTMLIQFADITGVPGVSFLVVAVNVLLKDFLKNTVIKNSENRARLKLAFLTTGVLIGAVLAYGWIRLSADRQDQGGALSVSVIQANIPQEMKWDQRFWPQILKTYQDLTLQASVSRPDLIIWPETSFPGYVGVDKIVFYELRQFIRSVGVPVLLGSVVFEDNRYYNSALLVGADGKVRKRYDKIHLVPFGEFIPLRKFFPFLEKIVPIGDFTSGSTFVTFSTGGWPSAREKALFSVLICFEDTVARLSPGFIEEGASFLVNITNDAWFKDTIEPFLHLQSSVFRAIETRRPIVRAANTGISCFIDRYGRIRQAVRDQNGKMTYVVGYATAKIEPHDSPTFYVRYGNIFVLGCVASVVVGWILIGDRHLWHQLK